MKHIVLATAILSILGFFVGLLGVFSAFGVGVLAVSDGIDGSSSSASAISGYSYLATAAHIIYGILFILGIVSIFPLSKNNISYTGAILVALSGLIYQIPFLGIPATILVIIGGIILLGKWKKIP